MPKPFSECQAYRDMANNYVAESVQNNPTQLMRYAHYHLYGHPGDSYALPEDLDITEQYPGVDPKGMFCDMDMGFMQRLNQVKITAALCSPAHQRAIGGIFQQLGQPYSDLHSNVLRPMQEAAASIRNCDRAIKMAPTEEVRAELESLHLRDSHRIQRFNELVCNMEYMVGLRDTPVDADAYTRNASDLEYTMTDDEKPLMHRSLSNITRVYDTDMDLLHQSSDQINPRPNLNIPYPDIKNILAQQYNAHPSHANQLTEAAPDDYRTPARAEKAVENAVTGAAKYSLDAMYQKIEARHPNSNHPELPNRGTLITVDGKTVAQRMAEEYQAAGKSPTAYNQWYKDNLSTKTAEYVSAGLMAGKRVESFFPDREGRLPNTPTVITKTGVEPTALQPVTLNAWERFFSKRGYYKEKVAQKADYDRIMEGRNAVAETMRDTGLKQETLTNHEANAKLYDTATIANSDSTRDFFMGRHLIDGKLPPTKGELKVHRDNVTSACMCKLAADGHPFEDILDPNKLQEEKNLLSDYYVAVATGKTPPALKTGEGGPSETPDKGAENIGNWIYNGQKAIANRLNAEMVGLDYYNLEQHPNFALWSNMAAVGFDASQNKASSYASTHKGFLDAAEADFQNNPDLRKEMEKKHSDLRDIPAGQALSYEQRLKCASLFDGPILTISPVLDVYNSNLKATSAPMTIDTVHIPVGKALLAHDLAERSRGQTATLSQLTTPIEIATLTTQATLAVHQDPNTMPICNANLRDRWSVERDFSSVAMADSYKYVIPHNLQSYVTTGMQHMRNDISAHQQRMEHTPQANAPTREPTHATPQARAPRH